MRDVADMYRLMKESTKPFCHHTSEKQSGGVTLFLLCLGVNLDMASSFLRLLAL